MMLPIYLLAAHLVGDFILQTRWQAAGKFDDWTIRLRHVLAYCVPFVPIAALHSESPGRLLDFLLLLGFLHFLTDSRRFYSTLGDVLAWPFLSSAVASITVYEDDSPDAPLDSESRWFPPSNPWAPVPILIDQTLHVCQVAILGGLFLS